MSTIKSFSVEGGDTFYIKHGSSNFTVIDCNLKEIVDEIIRESSGKDIFRFISTHPDEDHIHGLEYLDDAKGISNFYCVKNHAAKADSTASFSRYCELRDSSKAFYLKKGCLRCWMNKDDEEKCYGSAGINVLWPDVNNASFRRAMKSAADGLSPNDISPILTYSLNGGVKAIWMGDLETDFMEEIEDCVNLPPVDILFAPHHGRFSGKPPKSWMKEMSPSLVVVGEAGSDNLDYYQGYTHICQNTAGDIVFECGTGRVDVYADEPYEVVGFDDRAMPSAHGLSYWGSIETKN